MSQAKINENQIQGHPKRMKVQKLEWAQTGTPGWGRVFRIPIPLAADGGDCLVLINGIAQAYPEHHWSVQWGNILVLSEKAEVGDMVQVYGMTGPS